MRYQILLTIFFFLLVAKNGLAQNMQQAAVNQSIVAVAPDTADLNMQVPMAELKDSMATDYGLYYGMPVVKPGLFDAKMNYWWPETDYHYTMPNAHPGNQNLFRFNVPKQDK